MSTQALRYKHPQGHTASGRREDLGCFMRSSTEANVARVLTWMNLEWEYEPQEFKFDKVERGVRFFLPDFRVVIPEPSGNRKEREWWPRALDDLPAGTYWLEVKGWMDHTSQTKIARFIDYYPLEAARLLIVTRNPPRSRSKWGVRLNEKIEKAGVRLIDSRPILALGAMMQLPGWEGRKR